MVIGIGILVIVLASLALVYFKQAGEQKRLNKQFALAKSRLDLIDLAALSSRQAELDGQLVQVTSQSKAVKGILSQPVGSVTANSVLFDLAQVHGLRIIEVTSSTPDIEKMEGIVYSAVSLTAKVEGDVSDLIKFVSNVNDFLITGAIRSAVITIPETSSDEEAALAIQLVVYTHQGD